MITVSVDPGKHHVGLAVFRNDELVHARTVWVVEDWPRNTSALTSAVAFYLESHGAVPADCVAFEFPKIRIDKGRVQEKNPNALRHLWYTGGLVNAIARPKTLRDYEPSEWKGTIKKGQKIEQVKRKLSESENVRLTTSITPPVFVDARYEFDLNTWDAIGIGLRFLDRMHR